MRDALLLAAEKRWPREPTVVVVAVRQRGDQVVDLGGPGGGLDLLVGGVGAGVTQVLLPDAGVQQVRRPG